MTPRRHLGVTDGFACDPHVKSKRRPTVSASSAPGNREDYKRKRVGGTKARTVANFRGGPSSSIHDYQCPAAIQKSCPGQLSRWKHSKISRPVRSTRWWLSWLRKIFLVSICWSSLFIELRRRKQESADMIMSSQSGYW